MNERYSWAGGAELLHLRPGGTSASVIVALPPFEEANRTRALAATIARDLNARGYTVAIPDLPGTGESAVATADARLTHWRAAYAAAARALPGRVHGIAIRAGALVDVEADLASRWLLSPQGGASLVRELTRLRQLGDGLAAGNAMADAMFSQLAEAELPVIGAIRTVRLASEAQPADRKIEAAPLWRRAEPDNDPALAVVLADDIAEWISQTTKTPARAELVEARAAVTRPSTGSGRTGSKKLVYGPSLTGFSSAGETLVGTLDAAAGATGLLIVAGGNEIRTGAHRGMAQLAQRAAAAGHPVFRYDRRGIGDSTGENGGFERSGPDLAAAAAHFRMLQPQLTRIVGFGNCDAATALALFGGAAGIGALVLANPWTIEGADDLPPPAAIRARYAARLKDPRELWRLVSGGVSLAKLLRGLKRSRERPAAALAERLGAALAANVPVTVLTAKGDNTAIAFRAALPGVPVTERDTASHSFAAPGDADWLAERVLECVR